MVIRILAAGKSLEASCFKLQPSNLQIGILQASFNLPVPNNQYTSIKNIGASSYINNMRTLLIMIDGKLYGTRNYANGEVAIGEFTKQ